MPEIEIKDRKNNTVDKIDLRDDLFAVKAKQGVVYEGVLNYLANQRQGTHATKTKGLIRGGGKKPWRQKHTGRARAGSIRSPLWRGGGTVFGPQPRDYSYKLPKKVRRLGLMAALSEKFAGNEVIVLDSLSIEKPKTREMVGFLKDLGVSDRSVLIVLPEKEDNISLSARNIPGVNVVRVADLNTYDVLAHNVLLMTKDAALRLEELKVS